MMVSHKKVLGFFVAMLVASAMLAVACDDTSNAVKEPGRGQEGGPPLPGQDTGALPPGQDGSTGADGGPTDCVQTPHNPPTHFDIINACTDAVKITKNPTLPLQAADGGLPPLP